MGPQWPRRDLAPDRGAARRVDGRPARTGDEYLRAWSGPSHRGLPGRGNEITSPGRRPRCITGAAVRRVVVVLRTGAPLSVDSSSAPSRCCARTPWSARRTCSPRHPVNRGRAIRPKTLNQKRYVDAIDKYTITFGTVRPAPARPTWRWQGGAGAAVQAGQPDILTRPRWRRRTPRFLPAPLRKDRPYLRRSTTRCATCSTRRPSRACSPTGHRSGPLAYMRGRSQPTCTLVLTPDGYRSMARCGRGPGRRLQRRPTPVLGCTRRA